MQKRSSTVVFFCSFEVIDDKALIYELDNYVYTYELELLHEIWIFKKKCIDYGMESKKAQLQFNLHFMLKLFNAEKINFSSASLGLAA